MSGPIYRVPPLSRASIRELALTVRQVLGVDSLHFPIMQVLEFVLPSLEKDYVFEVGSLGDMGSNHGLTYPESKTIILREDVYEKALAGSGRDRMTAAHELGHLLLHSNVALARADGMKDIKIYESSEWQANCFGGELLIPASHRSEIVMMDVSKIAERCEVSLEAAEKQFKEMRKLQN
ncbi:ImmA/IrrE family metallo-endopeptidase [Aeromonas caviae]|uniref:ImmA/IrrE family metallo-endopeptidase n=1 Tax=Aeromonas caviae TaxID=648 RepID=UPI003F74A3EC